MKTIIFSVGVLAFAIAGIGLADLPKSQMQVIEFDGEDDQTGVVLESGETLQLMIPNGSGGFATDVKVYLNNTPLKLVKMFRVHYRDEQGRRAVGGGGIAAQFEAIRAGSGKLVIKIPRSPDNGIKEVRLDVTVERASGAGAPGN